MLSYLLQIKLSTQQYKEPMSAFHNMVIRTLIDLKHYIPTVEDIFEEEVFDPKDCMIDYALQTKMVKRSDKRLSDDNFTYKDWSLGVYSKSRNLLISP